jgi:hypothetical protein
MTAIWLNMFLLLILGLVLGFTAARVWRRIKQDWQRLSQEDEEKRQRAALDAELKQRAHQEIEQDLQARFGKGN